jgi:hypothetical protein
MQYFLPANYSTVRKALKLCHREDLIGTDRNALVPPERTKEVLKIPKKKGKQGKKTVDKRRRNG